MSRYGEFTLPWGDDDELEVTVVITYATPVTPARLYGHPDTWAPAEGGDLDFYVKDSDGKVLSLTQAEYRFVEGECEKYLEGELI